MSSLACLWGSPRYPLGGDWLDTDLDGIPDVVEVDPSNASDSLLSGPQRRFIDLYGYYAPEDTRNPEKLGAQFNPLVRENFPPEIKTVSISEKVKWKAFWVEHTWSIVHVKAEDVGEISSVTVKILDSGSEQTILGAGGVFDDTFTLTISYWKDHQSKYKVRVTAGDTAGNVYTHTELVYGEGLLGRAQGAIAAFLTALAEVISDAIEFVAKAVNWLIDWVVDTVRKGLEVFITPIKKSYNIF